MHPLPHARGSVSSGRSNEPCPSAGNAQPHHAALRARRSRGSKIPSPLALLLFVPALASTGCGHSQGALLYMLGFGQGKKIPAKFVLTETPIMILVDDVTHRINSPLVRRQLVNDLSQELLRNEAAKRIVPLATVEHLRQTLPRFEQRGGREIGELGGAEQVIWIQVQDFRALEQIEEVTAAAFFSVTIKVLNVLEKKNRRRVRLWPTSPNGHPIIVLMTGSEVAIEGTRARIGKELTKRLATNIAKLFYEHRLGDFEREQ